MQEKSEKSNALFKTYLYPIFLLVIGGLVTYLFTYNSPSKPEVESTIIYNTGSFNETLVEPFKLEKKTDKTAWCIVNLINKGDARDEDLEVEFNLLKNDNKILNYLKKYDPPFLSKKVNNFEKSEKRFYEKIDSFPSYSYIEYKFILKEFLNSEDDYLFFACSKFKNWGKLIKRIPKYSLTTIINVAYAQEKGNRESQPETSRSGISLGGYDPIILSNGLFQLLQNKKTRRSRSPSACASSSA